MKKVFFLYILFVKSFFAECNNNYIDTSTIGLTYLKAYVSDENKIEIKYEFKKENVHRTININHPIYSNVTFPEVSIGLISNNQYNTSNIHIIGDTILVLPLIGISNKLHIYIINLKNGFVFQNDIRTSISVVWIDNQTNSFICANGFKGLENNEYTFKMYKIKRDEIQEYHSHKIVTTEDFSEDIQKEFNFIIKFFP